MGLANLLQLLAAAARPSRLLPILQMQSQAGPSRQRCRPGSKCDTGCHTCSARQQTHQAQPAPAQNLPRRPQLAAGLLLQMPIQAWGPRPSMQSSVSILQASSARPWLIRRLRRPSLQHQHLSQVHAGPSTVQDAVQLQESVSLQLVPGVHDRPRQLCGLM